MNFSSSSGRDFDLFSKRRQRGSRINATNVVIAVTVVVLLVVVAYFTLDALFTDVQSGVPVDRATRGQEEPAKGKGKARNRRVTKEKEKEEEKVKVEEHVAEKKDQLTLDTERADRVELLNFISLLEARISGLERRVLSSEEKNLACREEVDAIKKQCNLSEDCESVKRAFELCSTDISWMMDRTAALERLLEENNVDFSTVP